MKLIGILLIVFGVVALAVGGFSYTEREKVLDIGPLEATTETPQDDSRGAHRGHRCNRGRHRPHRSRLPEARVDVNGI